MAQSLPSHAQSSINVPPSILSVTPEITLSVPLGSDSPFITGVNMVSSSGSGNIVNLMAFQAIFLSTINMNLEDQFTSNMTELDVTIVGELSMTSINGPSETDFSGIAVSPNNNLLINPGLTIIPIDLAQGEIIFEEIYPIVVPSSPSADPIDYLFEYKAQITINSPDVDANIQDASISYVVTVTHQDSLTFGILATTFPKV